MNLGDLPASELARLDSICLNFESALRSGDDPEIESWVAEHGGQNGDLLRTELIAIRAELQETPAQGAAAAETVGFGMIPSGIALPTTGDVVGPYEIGDSLGRGGMGVVYQAVDQRLDRAVAIKVLAVDSDKRRDLSERFRREAKAVAALSHPNIVELFDIGTYNGLPYAVMEFLDGELLDQRFKSGPMCPYDVRRLGAQVADALAAAHKGDVVHRDLKPHNIMLVRRQGGDASSNCNKGGDDEANLESTVIKLFDFGLSRSPSGDPTGATETGEGIILGTPGYMAPEQARGESVTNSADIFSLGCVLHEAFYGKRAFDGTSTVARFRSTIEDDPDTDATIRRTDVTLADLIEQCLQKDPAARPKSAAWIASQLRKPVKPAGIPVATTPCGTKTISRRTAIAAATGATALGALGIWWMTQGSGSLRHIDSIAVLSFADDATDNEIETDSLGMPRPLGERKLSQGEQLAAMLVHELTRLSDLSVPQFRPIRPSTLGDLQQLQSELGVDAFLFGSLASQAAASGRQFMVIDVRLVDAKTGEKLWNTLIQTDQSQELLDQSQLASKIASALGRRLKSTSEDRVTPDAQSFSCMVDGAARSDPDSVVGMQKALACFQHAHEVDDRFAEPIAGIALTSITLAAQADAAESLELVVNAQEKVADALKIKPSLIDARLAEAMLDWQITNRYAQAESRFRELSMIAPNRWQVKHQFGLLQMTLGKHNEASKSLREATQLNPWSLIAKVDRARNWWYSGNTEKAVREAIRLNQRHESDLLAVGLLIDLYEESQRYQEAADLLPSINSEFVTTADQYWRAREETLAAYPYGPFGAELNRTLFNARSGKGVSEDDFAALEYATLPMLPLLLAKHPALRKTRALARASEIMPQP